MPFPVTYDLNLEKLAKIALFTNKHIPRKGQRQQDWKRIRVKICCNRTRLARKILTRITWVAWLLLLL